LPFARSTSFSVRPAIAGLRVGMLSTYPPKICGLATFASALGREFQGAGHSVQVVRVVDEPTTVGESAASLPYVVAELVNGDPRSLDNVAKVLSQSNVAIVQHEYGIFGGPDGEDILVLLRAISAPTIVVLHTVPLHPSDNQRRILGEIASIADQVVVMTQSAHDRLLALYPVSPRAVSVIAHGATIPQFSGSPSFDAVTVRSGPATAGGVPQLLTWGLLGPGKGIEHVVRALSILRDLGLRPRYTVAGITHPKIVARDGHAYRDSVIDDARRLGVAETVQFDDTYRDVAELTRFIATSTVVVLPYDSKDQVTSGVLVDAIAAGRPVISTAFPHACELLASGAGIVVAHGDDRALAEAIRSVMLDKKLLQSMSIEAKRLSASLTWSVVAEKYCDLASTLVRASRPVAI
jgi:polysaccharide biosynthesis protein PslF